MGQSTGRRRVADPPIAVPVSSEGSIQSLAGHRRCSHRVVERRRGGRLRRADLRPRTSAVHGRSHPRPGTRRRVLDRPDHSRLRRPGIRSRRRGPQVVRKTGRRPAPRLEPRDRSVGGRIGTRVPGRCLRRAHSTLPPPSGQVRIRPDTEYRACHVPGALPGRNADRVLQGLQGVRSTPERRAPGGALRCGFTGVGHRLDLRRHDRVRQSRRERSPTRAGYGRSLRDGDRAGHRGRRELVFLSRGSAGR